VLRLERKAVPAEYKTDLAKREVTGYAAIFGNVDLGGDRIVKGAFTKTLADDMPAGRIKVRRNHDSAIGMPIHMEQDSKGLLTVSKISATPLGDETLTLIGDGVVDRMSIGYIVDGAEGKRYVQDGGRKIRELLSLSLAEYSLLDVPPMNPEAALVGVKSLDDVCYAIDRMQSAVYYLRGLSNVDAETAARVQTLLTDLGSLPSAYGSSDADDIAGVSALLTDFNSYLTSSARSA
jgi:HK97 family phage prohead protease